jgi:small subunit ribosomal protein S4e
MIVMRRLVEVDGKVRTDINYPAGFMDVVQMDKTDERFRLLYDVKGRFVLHRISKEESQYKLCRVQQVSRAKKASIGRNPLQHGQLATIPYLVTHDGRTIRYADPAIRVNDVVKLDIATGKVSGHLKFEAGNTCMVTRGANVGRIGVITRVERHPGSFDIVHLQDKKGLQFATRAGNVFVIGDGQKPLISLPRGKGLKQTIMEERDRKAGKKEKSKE